MASGFHELEMGKQGVEVSEISMAAAFFKAKAKATPR